ncbi:MULTISPECIES: maleylacetate reductase [unclassified Modestobacter]|uniref:maleylacetate reductase n=1 Tax=unclassified Modestobacter TaxID=2643866 RepID=UPI0022AAD1CC|nr:MULTISPECIES: maleylacetate reductase [unclassified Modestobacter]MCZ2824232.1 maleylacetate reductase [Modestobacter sp. VKM Ac-2981]MCZ2854240.1 maleylacetate reductase [Modestobacter sp. VKM Ac-2982]
MSDERFDLDGLPTRVLFGPGRRADVPGEVARLGGRRVLIVTGRSQQAAVAEQQAALGTAHVATLDGAVEHVPVASAARARAVADEVDADLLLAVGGGSAVGLAKAVALTSGRPLVVVPTTYSGSEMTPIWGTTEEGRKTTGRDERVRPSVVVYDPELTVDLPSGTTASSGMNAVAHCVEALWLPGANPLIRALAEEGVRELGDALPALAHTPRDLGARAAALRGAWLGGTVLALAGTGLHHKICHELGGLGLPHAPVHAAVLPAVAALLSEAAPDALRRVARALAADDGVAALRQLAVQAGAATSLGDLGLRVDQVDEVAERVAALAPAAPRAVSAADVRGVLHAALTGGT